MTMEEREAANEQLRNPPEFKLTSTARLGLYVVGKLAERHGIRVRLTESPYGGTTAIVLLPSTLIADAGGDEVLRLDAGGGEPVTARPHPVTGRHRNDSPAFAGQPQTAVRGGPDLDMPLYSHVMQAELSTAVPTTAPPEPAVSATAVVDSFTVDDLPVRPVGAERGAQAPSPWSPPPTMPTPTPVAPPSTPTPTATPIPAPVPNPAPTQPAPTVLTPSGLPWRQRPAPESASAAAPAESRTDPEPPPSAASDNGWSPGGSAAVEAPTPRPIRGLEESRNLMASYRSGTMRGRSEAARLAETNNHTPEWTQPTQESVGSEDGG
jgi:hypothetical protein